MKTELEKDDIKAIAEELIKMLTPILASLINDNGTEDEFLTMDEAAKLLGVSKDQIYQWTSQTKHGLNDMPYKKSGRQNRFPKKALIEWMESKKYR